MRTRTWTWNGVNGSGGTETGTGTPTLSKISGAGSMPFFKNRLKNLTNMTPDAVAMMKENAPRIKIKIESQVRNCEAWVEAPTVSPNRIVILSLIHI